MINREAEHGLAFEKRVLELGYSLIERANPEAGAKLAVLSDEERAADKVYQRKLAEIVLAQDLSRQYTKNEILNLYLNEIY